VNASRRPSRDAAHHSGSGRMASPYPVGDFHLLFFASFSWRTPLWVKRVVLTLDRSLPIYPDKQTFSASVGMSPKCQHETHAPQQNEPQSITSSTRMNTFDTSIGKLTRLMDECERRR
jgi:hypothetical protein